MRWYIALHGYQGGRSQDAARRTKRFPHLQEQTGLSSLYGFVHSTHDRRQHLIHLVFQSASDFGVLWVWVKICCNVCDNADRESRVLSQVGES